MKVEGSGLVPEEHVKVTNTATQAGRRGVHVPSGGHAVNGDPEETGAGDSPVWLRLGVCQAGMRKGLRSHNLSLSRILCRKGCELCSGCSAICLALV